MPSFKMKTKSCTGCLKEKNGLRVCQTSIIVSKNSCAPVKISLQTAELDSSVEFFQDVSPTNKVSTQNIGNDEAIDHSESLDGENPQLQKQPSSLVDSLATERMESTPTTCQSSMETIFSPTLESAELHSELTVNGDGGTHNDIGVPKLGAEDSDDNNNRSLHDCQTCNVTDFYISDMIIAGLPFDGNTVYEDITETNPYLDYQCAESNMFFDVGEEYTILPFLEDTVDTTNIRRPKSSEEILVDSNDSSLYLAIHQMKPCNQDSNIAPYSDLNPSSECFDPHMFIRNLPELSDVSMLPKESQKKKFITLVLDLDETLVHSTLEPSDDAHFTFPVFFNMKQHTVYVKQRPFLQAFLERVAEMFEIVLFTASQSIYAAQLLDILDPDGKIFSRRAYRESCIFSDGSYTKDLTVLGVDLAKVAIIDNSPQVFRLQVNNGIPIKSWFDDPSDHALISLLPFLETLVDVDDVRPIIAKRFGNKE